MKTSCKRLPDGELEIMQALWEQDGPATRAQLEKSLNVSHPMAPTTILTCLSRLGEKGFVSQEKQGRSSVFTPLISKKDYLASQSSRFFKNLCGGSVRTFASALCDSGLSKEDLRELRQLLEEDAL